MVVTMFNHFSPNMKINRHVLPKNEIPIKLLEADSQERRSNEVMLALTAKDKLQNAAIWLQKSLLELESINGVAKVHKQASVLMKKATISKNNVCAVGCAGCCTSKATATYIEARYIESKTGRSISVSSQNGADENCTFLSNDMTCSIYEYRPLSCRAKFAITNWNDCFVPSALPELSIDVIEPVNAAQYLLAQHIRNEHGIGVLNINQWFSARPR